LHCFELPAPPWFSFANSDHNGNPICSDVSQIQLDSSVISWLTVMTSLTCYISIVMSPPCGSSSFPAYRGSALVKTMPSGFLPLVIFTSHTHDTCSKPLAVDNPLLLPEREVHAEIGINWFLDQEIPKGGYIRILTELLLWEERLGKTRIRTTENLITCMEPHRGWTIASSSWNFLRKRWLDWEQGLITVIQEKTKRTEEKEEAGFRSPTWSILRALQKINKAKRLEGEAVMSAPPFFQSAGQGDLK